MDVIPLDATLIKGSHGGIFCEPEYYPIYISDQKSLPSQVEAPEVYDLIWKTIFQ